jgi:hypothetical protein
MQPAEDIMKNSIAGPIKTFTLRGIEDSPPYLHDGRLLTVGFFNLVLRSATERPGKTRSGRVHAPVVNT